MRDAISEINKGTKRNSPQQQDNRHDQQWYRWPDGSLRMSKPQGKYVNKPRTYNDRKAYKTEVGDIDLTEQSHADGCDLEQIMRRYTQQGILPTGNTRGQPTYGDAPDQEQDYSQIMRTVALAKSQFEELPMELKKTYGDVQTFVDNLHKLQAGAKTATEGGDPHSNTK